MKNRFSTTGPDATRYGEWIYGTTANHNLKVRFDVTRSGYLGITQPGASIERIERVLLSPAQVQALLTFLALPARRDPAPPHP